MSAADSTKPLSMPPVFGGSGAPEHMPPGQETLEVPPTLGGDTPSALRIEQKPLTLPPTI